MYIDKQNFLCEVLKEESAYFLSRQTINQSSVCAGTYASWETNKRNLKSMCSCQTYDIIRITEMCWGSLRDWSGPRPGEGQQEGLLQVHWQQKENEGNCEVMAQQGTRPRDKGHGRG